MTRDPSSFEHDALRYLLDPVSEEERARFEAGLLEEAGRVEELAAIEDALIDRYVLGELAGEELARFEQNFRSLPGREEKIAFARGLARAAGRVDSAAAAGRRSTAPAARQRFRRWARPVGIAAAAAACALLAFWLLRGPGGQGSGPGAELARGNAPTAVRPMPAPSLVTGATGQERPGVPVAGEPEPKPVLLALALSGTRAAGGARLTLRSDTRQVVLQIDLEGETGFAAFSARLLSADGALAWSAPRVVADAKASLLELHLPAAALSPGTFHLVIAGLGDAAARPQELAALSLEVVRSPARN